MTINPPYTLLDSRPIAADAPYTFFLPSPTEIAAVSKDDLVKLTFEYTQQVEKWSAERMWVIVEDVEFDGLLGRLEDQPDEPTSPLKPGNPIQFNRHHILDIRWTKPQEAPSPPTYREYWERCLVDKCVIDGSSPVEYLYREEPNMEEEGDIYPDSGWRIRGAKESASDEDIDARKVEYVAVGLVLNQDDSWLSLIDSPAGSEFMLDSVSGTFCTYN